jgi:hypothetical protein
MIILLSNTVWQIAAGANSIPVTCRDVDPILGCSLRDYGMRFQNSKARHLEKQVLCPWISKSLNMLNTRAALLLRACCSLVGYSVSNNLLIAFQLIPGLFL